MGAKPVERYKALCTVVIDTGTGHTRSGLARDQQPQSMVPSQAGSSPVLTHSMVTEWDGLEELGHRILYRELGVCPEEVVVLAMDALLSPTTNQEKAAELLFKGFGVPAMLVLPCSLLAAYSYGRTASAVVGCGVGISYVAGVQEGYTLPHTTFRLDAAGDALTLYLGRLLGSPGIHPGAETLALLEGDLLPHPARGWGPGGALPLTLPGASGLLLGDERFCCPEALLAPDAPGLPGLGLLEQAAHSLRCCGGPLAAPHLLLPGGTTLLHSFPWRLAAELGVPPRSRAPPPRSRLAGHLTGRLPRRLPGCMGAMGHLRGGRPHRRAPPLLLTPIKGWGGAI
ncbi:actin-like [Gavia stellata]|uniref:actin-like n=1 Tax=Gavia stellata TaxID=37040 RepID=UPI00289E2572|nr:actin-like [Gavia stellata]